jgi:hypothetical protein
MRRFTNNAKIPQYRILKHGVRCKISRGFSLRVSLDSFEGGAYVFEVILGAFRMLAHTG